MIKRYASLIRLEMQSELKSGNILLTAGIQSCVFVLILYYGMLSPEGMEWATFFWMISVFAALSGLNHSFVQSNKGLSIYLFQLFSAKEYFIVRWAINLVFVLILTCITLGLLLLFYGYNPVSLLPFLTLVLLGSIGFAAIFTFTGSIASVSKNALVLLPVISVPLLIPLIIVLFKASSLLLEPSSGIAEIYLELLLILLLDLLYFLPGLLLFPNLWGE